MASRARARRGLGEGPASGRVRASLPVTCAPWSVVFTMRRGTWGDRTSPGHRLRAQPKRPRLAGQGAEAVLTQAPTHLPSATGLSPNTSPASGQSGSKTRYALWSNPFRVFSLLDLLASVMRWRPGRRGLG